MNLQSPVVFQCLSEILARIAFGCGAFPLVLKLPVLSGATRFFDVETASSIWCNTFLGVEAASSIWCNTFLGVEAASSIWCNTSSLLKLPVSSSATHSLVLTLPALTPVQHVFSKPYPCFLLCTQELSRYQFLVKV